jgi:serine/threonine protein kinase
MRGTIGGLYRLKTVIGAGGFGTVHCAGIVDSEKEVAVKISSDETKNRRLETEASVYKLISDSVGFPNFIDSGEDRERSFLVMELLGKPLSTLLHDQDNAKFSLKTVLMLIEQMLERVQYIHSIGILHRDLKPSNFLIGLGPKSNQVYLIDFGLSADYSRLGRVESEIVGTSVFSSVNTQRGMPVSRRDDLESLGYVFVFLATGSLPWEELAGDRKNREKIGGNLVAATKSSISVADLCVGLPTEFGLYLEAVKNLEFNEEPDYAGYRKMFRDLFTAKGFVYDYQFDWRRAVRGALSFDFVRPRLLSASDTKLGKPGAKAVARRPTPLAPKSARFVSPTPDLGKMRRGAIRLDIFSG